MVSKLIKDVSILAIFIIIAVFGWQNRLALYKLAGLPSPDTPTQQAAPHEDSTAEPIAQTPHGSTITLHKAADGHFWAKGQVNRGMVTFLVDTGASTVALTLEDAKKAGIDVKKLTYNVPIRTANGTVMAAKVRLKSVALGTVKVRDIDAVVVPDGLSVSLLGMGYLGELQKVEATRDIMILRR